MTAPNLAITFEAKDWETRPSPPNGDMRPVGVRGLPGYAINRRGRIAIHAAASDRTLREMAFDDTWFFFDATTEWG